MPKGVYAHKKFKAVYISEIKNSLMGKKFNGKTLDRETMTYILNLLDHIPLKQLKHELISLESQNSFSTGWRVL
jgi:hypothetical protein